MSMQKNKRILSACIRIVFGLFASIPMLLLGQGSFDLSALKPGEVLLNISAQETKAVSQDLLIATVMISFQGRDKVEIQNSVNQSVKKAITALKQHAELSYSTERYHVYRIHPDRSDTFKAQQSIRIESKQSSVLLDAVGSLQAKGFQVHQLQFALSSEKFEEVSDSLMSVALVKLQARADEAAGVLDKSSARLIDVTVNSSPRHQRYRPVAMAKVEAAASLVQAPVAEPGQTEVFLTVSAKALLGP